MLKDIHKPVSFERPQGQVIFGLFVFLLATSVPPVVIASMTMDSVIIWYPGLAKPPLNPPAWVFGPVWSVLYAMIGISGWLIWKNHSFAKSRNAFILYFAQLVFNFAWSFLFFGLENPVLGLMDLLVLDVLVVLTFLRFKKLDRASALLLIPYLLWIAFATYLNAGIWLLNQA